MRARTALDDWWQPALTWLTAVACLAACDSSPPSAADVATSATSAAGSGNTAVAEATTKPVFTTGDSARATPSTENSNDATALMPAWALGAWRGQGSGTVNQLQLPNNQGVQIGWLKDKGTGYVGELELSLTLDKNGQASGQLTGALGTLSISGAWPPAGPLHLELRSNADGPEMFHGTLTVVWDEAKMRATATLRASSGDGQWLRASSLELTRA